MSTLLHVGIRASNLERSIRFWRDGLGLKVAKQRVEIAMISRTAITTSPCFNIDGEERPAHLGGMLDYLHIGVGVPDVAAAAKRLREMGYEIFSDGLGGKEPLDPENLEETRIQSGRSRRDYCRCQWH